MRHFGIDKNFKRRNVIVINGKFLSETLTGMQRYAVEIVKELDEIIQKDELIIITSRKTKNIPQYKNIRVIRKGIFTGIPWEQISLPLYLLREDIKFCVNLLGSVPMFMPKGIVVAHGVNNKVNPQYFRSVRDKVARLWHITNFWWYFRYTKEIITVSEFSRTEIARVYGIDYNKISIVPPSWQHMNDIIATDYIFEKYPVLKEGEFFFTLSSVNHNKNFKWVVEVAKRNPEKQFAIAGRRSLEKYLRNIKIKKPANLHFLGRVSDEDAKALMQKSCAFLFPSFYEGFGLPPLEALACGTKAIVSDTITMHEVYGDSVYYINPYDSNVDLEEIMSKPIRSPEYILGKYSWRKSAEKLLEIIRKYE